mmetsp:Transcript_22776/g.51539  ORF Transcript_22776/g.51539 Transcript_22776/m.51539 type:complete len:475 (-) Transcript_22776:166-1590(-)
MGPTTGLASASRLLSAHAGALRHIHGRELLNNSGVDADGVVEVGLGRTAFHRHPKTLGHLASGRSADVQTKHTLIVRDVADEFRIARIVAPVRDCPLERLEVGMVNFDVLSAVHGLGLLLRQAAAAVLERRVDGRGDIRVVHLQRPFSKHAQREQFACLDGDGRQLGQGRWRAQAVSIDDVANGVDVRHVCLLVGDGDFAIGDHLDASCLEAHTGGTDVTANCQQDGIELLRTNSAIGVLPSDLLAPLSSELDGRWDCPLDEGHSALLHVILDVRGHLLVEAAQRDGAHHYLCLETEAVDEARALQRDVRCTHSERLPRRCAHGEDVIRADAMLFCTRNVEVLGAPADGDDKFVGGDRRLLAFLIHRHDGVRVFERREGIEVLDGLAHQLCTIPKVERLNMHLHRSHHVLPFVLRHLWDVPAILFGILHGLAQLRRLVHQLLWDAANVHTRTAQAPSRACRRRLDKIADGDLFP